MRKQKLPVCQNTGTLTICAGAQPVDHVQVNALYKHYVSIVIEYTVVVKTIAGKVQFLYDKQPKCRTRPSKRLHKFFPRFSS